jgi:hypothetical protein
METPDREVSLTVGAGIALGLHIRLSIAGNDVLRLKHKICIVVVGSTAFLHHAQNTFF